MKKLLLFILVTSILQNAISQNNDAETLTKLNQDWLNSSVTKDKETLNRIFAEDFILISPKGIKMTKHDIIKTLDQQETVSIKVDSIDVRLLTADVGLITAYTTFVLKIEGKNATGQNCYQDVYVRRCDQDNQLR